MIGPVDIPWEARKWFFDIQEGNFRLAVQDFRIEKKTLKLLDMGFRDKHIMSSGTTATHSSGAPVVGMKVVEAVFELAAEAELAIGDAYLAFCMKAKVKLHPDFEEAIKDSPKRYVESTAAKLRQVQGGESDDEAIRRLEVELHMRKENRAKTTPTIRRRVSGGG